MINSANTTNVYCNLWYCTKCGPRRAGGTSSEKQHHLGEFRDWNTSTIRDTIMVIFLEVITRSQSCLSYWHKTVLYVLDVLYSNLQQASA